MFESVGFLHHLKHVDVSEKENGCYVESLCKKCGLICIGGWEKGWRS